MKTNWSEDAQSWILEVSKLLLVNENWDNAEHAFNIAEQWAYAEQEMSASSNVAKWLTPVECIDTAFGYSEPEKILPVTVH